MATLNGLRNITGRVNGDGTVTIWGVTSTRWQVKLIADETEKWSKVIKFAGIKPS